MSACSITCTSCKKTLLILEAFPPDDLELSQIERLCTPITCDLFWDFLNYNEQVEMVSATIGSGWCPQD